MIYDAITDLATGSYKKDVNAYNNSWTGGGSGGGMGFWGWTFVILILGLAGFFGWKTYKSL